jgi:hypothetical protein
MAEALFSPLCVRMLEDGHAVRFQAPGSSMHPAIRDGEWMTVEPTRPASARRGDVLLYLSVRGLTAHRLVRVVMEEGTPAQFVFRGDNAGALEEHVDFTNVLGRVARVERGRRHIDPASMRARLASEAWRTIAELKRMAKELAAGLRLRSLYAKRGQHSARQGGLS